MKLKIRAALAAILIFLPLAASFGQLREIVAIVEPRFYESTRQQFTVWAEYFEEAGDEYWERFFRWYSGEFGSIGHGTGWLYVDADGENYIITNRHVVKQAATAHIIFEQEDGSRKTYEDCPIVFVDDFMDLAVLRFPDGEKVYGDGFPILERRQPDGTQIVAAGFPGFGSGEPLWQYSAGIVSNAAARIDSNYDYLIQHTAPIDPGNSGGPLMVQDTGSVVGFRVIGVNTSKAVGRENTNFAIPAIHVLDVIDKAKTAIRQESDEDLLVAELQKEARALAKELSSDAPDQDRVGRYISYAFVGERGLESYSGLVGLLADTAEWEKRFQDDPIETMRTAIQIRFGVELQSKGDLSTMLFSEVNKADVEDILRQESIRTSFTISGENVEMEWIREYGHWRIMNLDMLSLAASNAAVDGSNSRSSGESAESARQVWTVGVRAGGGSSGSEGAIFDYGEFQNHWGDVSWYAGVAADIPITQMLWLETGVLLSHVGHGYYYYGTTVIADFYEEITYLQVPLIGKVGLLGIFGNLFIGAGVALDFAIATTGEYDSYIGGGSGSLTDAYFDEFLNPFNISFLAVASYEIGIGARTLIGLEAIYDYHLLGDFNWGVSETSHFSTLSGGLYAKYLF